jgi:dGTPase
MTASERQPYYDWQRGVLQELADALLAANGQHLDAYCRRAWSEAVSEAEHRRVIVDQIACLTDQSAITLHSNLVSR